jgi:hypothetical protein
VALAGVAQQRRGKGAAAAVARGEYSDFVLGEPTGEFLASMNAYDAAIASAYYNNRITNLSLDHYKFPKVAAASLNTGRITVEKRTLQFEAVWRNAAFLEGGSREGRELLSNTV